MVEELRKKLSDSIIKYGLESKETYEISRLLDKEIDEYYKNIQKKQKKYCKTKKIVV
jgi:hypothetical protein